MSALRRVERQFTVPEAAALLRQSQKYVNNTISRELAPLKLSKVVGGKQRIVTSAGLLALELLREIGKLFSREGRREILRQALKPSSGDTVCVENGSVVVNLGQYQERVNRAKERLAEAERLVVRNPEILGGEPCVRGTRIPVYLAGALARKHGVVEANATYPSLPRQTIELVALYVEANPRKGRPRQAELSKPKTAAKRGKAKKIKLD
jgi:uncharacterized protein (DUF433 family)